MRLRRSTILVLLALVAGLAGCIGDEDLSGNEATSGADDGPGAPELPEDLAMGEGDVVARNASAVTFRWELTLPSSVAGSADPVTTDLDVPGDTLFAIDAEMTWEPGTPEDSRIVRFSVQDADERPRCRDVSGVRVGLGSVDLPGPPLACQAPYVPSLPARQSWTVVAEGAHVPQPTDATVTLTLSLVDGDEIEPALPDGGTGAPELSFADPVSVAPDVGQHEPAVDVAPDGTIYVSGYVDRPGLLWRSTDGGTSFEPIETGAVPYCNVPQTAAGALTGARAGPPAPETGPEYTHPGCGDTDLAAGEDGTVYWTQHYGGEAVAASHDGGDTWTTAVWASNEPAATDRQWLATDGGEQAWLVFNSPRRYPARLADSGGAAVSRTDDGGTTWRQVGAITDPFVIPGELTYDATRERLLLSGPTPGGPAVALSDDGGESWSFQRVADRSGSDHAGFCYVCGIVVSADVDAAGNAYVAWVDPSDGGTYDVWLARSTDGGESWAEPHKVNAVEGTHVMPWVSAGGPGEVAVAWYGTATEGDPETIDGAWHVHAAATEDATASDPAFAETLVSPHPVQFGPICLGGASCSDARNLGDFFEVAVDGDGGIHVAYTNGRAGGAWNDVSRVMYARGALEPTTTG